MTIERFLFLNRQASVHMNYVTLSLYFLVDFPFNLDVFCLCIKFIAIIILFTLIVIHSYHFESSSTDSEALNN